MVSEPISDWPSICRCMCMMRFPADSGSFGMSSDAGISPKVLWWTMVPPNSLA